MPCVRYSRSTLIQLTFDFINVESFKSGYCQVNTFCLYRKLNYVNRTPRYLGNCRSRTISLTNQFLTMCLQGTPIYCWSIETEGLGYTLPWLAQVTLKFKLFRRWLQHHLIHCSKQQQFITCSQYGLTLDYKPRACLSWKTKKIKNGQDSSMQVSLNVARILWCFEKANSILLFVPKVSFAGTC